jgi:hypothetical protein
MNMQKNISLSMIFIGLLLLAGAVWAHNPGYDEPSLGKPTSVMNINGVDDGNAEWGGATTFAIDYGNGNPLKGSVKVLHKVDGIYLLVAINDSSNNNNDALMIHFDINHNGSPTVESEDFGVEILRNGQAKWGKANLTNTDPFDSSGWVVISGANTGVTSTASNWTLELHLPTGNPSGLDLTTGTVGIHFMISDADNIFGTPSAKYTQWPKPPVANPDALLAGTPNQWGNYTFDPTTTFPNLAVTGVRRNNGNPADYYRVNYTGTNSFEVKVKDPGGTAIADATNVRLNLYLAARGIGEPWHRIDTASVLDGDCAAQWPVASSLPQADVCSGTASLDDITAKTINDVVNGTAKYTIKNGITMTRTGGQSATVTGGTENWSSVLDWNTTAAQDGYFKSVTVNGTTYHRQHQCMLAEALFASDPNISDNTMQVNLDFVGLPGQNKIKFPFTLGWAGFGKYDPNAGKDMFLQVIRNNMNPEVGWKYQLEGFEPVQEDVFVAKFRGEQSLPMQLALTAPAADVLGNPLKENLIVPPKSGGRQANARIPSGESPVYVKVEAGSTLLIANYAFSENDPQDVDLDGRGKLLPPNGPAGLPASLLQQALQKIGEKYRLLLTPNASLGALVGSFDNFRTAFTISEGVQVKVPADAKYLALGINDAVGLFDDNQGTGFRVKVSEMKRAVAMQENGFITSAHAQQTDSLQITPISEVMPTLCINGYENIDQSSTIDGKSHELFRYIGNVCWGIINVFPQDRSDKPDQGDPFEETPQPQANSTTVLIIFIILLLIIVILWWRRTPRKMMR